MTDINKLKSWFDKGNRTSRAHAAHEPELQIYSLSQRISDLRDEGYPVVAEKKVKNGKKYFEYYKSNN